jgi:hypothetical protein
MKEKVGRKQVCKIFESGVARVKCVIQEQFEFTQSTWTMCIRARVARSLLALLLEVLYVHMS